MKKVYALTTILLLLIGLLIYQVYAFEKPTVLSAQTKHTYWLLLHRKSNIMY